MALTSGFLFVAPVLATVFYCLSHRLEHHHKLPRLFVPLLSWRANPGSLGLFLVMLVFVLISWSAFRPSWSRCFSADRELPACPTC